MPSIADWDQEIKSLNMATLKKYKAVLEALKSWEFYARAYDLSTLNILVFMIDCRIEAKRLDQRLDKILGVGDHPDDPKVGDGVP